MCTCFFFIYSECNHILKNIAELKSKTPKQNSVAEGYDSDEE
jgi:hypothetical protein